MKPIVLIHGYSAESPDEDPTSIAGIYGDLPQRLRAAYQVIEIDLSRYVSLNDSVTISDIARALNRVLTEQYANLLQNGFHVVIHSTGALVIRKWIQLFSQKPSPIRNLVYLAGANLGSGWARIGQGQIARWGRFVFEHGAQRGLKVLQALELGSSETIDMHLGFLRDGTNMIKDYQVQEFIIIGTQADPAWFEFPVRYAHEDGSDGVVRVSGTNLNFNHIVIGPQDDVASLAWPVVQKAIQAVNGKTEFPSYYKVKQTSYAGKDRLSVPFGIVYQCAHTGDQMGIVAGELPRNQVTEMLRQALETTERSQDAWQNVVASFDHQTETTFDTAKTMQKPGPLNFLSDPRNQYDPHSQIVFRICDQEGLPVPIAAGDIFFVSNQQKKKTIPIQSIIEDTVVSGISRNVIVFYIRAKRFNKRQKDWIDQVADVSDFALEITAIEPATPVSDPIVIYLPLHIPLTNDQLKDLIQPHRTTVIDVTLLRLPSPEVYQLIRFA